MKQVIKKQNQKIALFLGIIFVMSFTILWHGDHVQAASGAVYTAHIVRSYEHPVTGEIEDAGGETAKTTGQGMVEGAVHDTGILEKTKSGNYYLTIELSLIDYTSNQTFQVQKRGDTTWSNPKLGITGTGSDSNGTTDYVCVKLPSKDAIVRCSMYVTEMGRDVVFYYYASDLKKGNSTSLPEAVVTSESNEKQTSEQDIEQESTEDTEQEGLTLSTESETTDEKTDESISSMERPFKEQLLLNVLSGVIIGIIMLAATSGVVYIFLKNKKRWFSDPFDDPDWEDEDEEN
ncbi:MAG: cell surface heme-binding protein Shp [Eubacterium sp.]|nr:cell surface heme-binding protein Shp [Eubacterium sp.]